MLEPIACHGTVGAAAPPPLRGHPGKLTAIVQLLLIATGSTAVLAPPANGMMVILPMVPGDPAATFRWASSAEASIIASGPYSGSIVVQGSRSMLLFPAFSHGALLITARFAGCGAK
jgi:hypothetical protein